MMGLPRRETVLWHLWPFRYIHECDGRTVSRLPRYA